MLGRVIFRIIFRWLATYWYIPVRWILRQTSKRKPPLDVAGLDAPTDQAIILTGATGNLGSALVKRLLQLEMHVVVGIRDFEKMEKIILEIREEGITTGSIEMMTLDFASLSSVRKFANEILERNIKAQMLINAAGTLPIPHELTPDGHEKQFQINFLAPFLLLNLLLLKMSRDAAESQRIAKIVNVSSAVQYYGYIDFDNLNGKKPINRTQMNYNSRLLSAVSTHFMGVKLKQNGIPIHANSVHPGFLQKPNWKSALYNFGPIKKFLDKVLTPPDLGVDDVLFVGFHPEAGSRTGMFFVNREVDEKFPKESWAVMERLWDEACQLVMLENDFKLVPSSTNPSNSLGRGKDDGEEIIEMEGVAINDQLRGSLHPTVTLMNREGSNQNRQIFKTAAVAPLDGNKTENLDILTASVPTGIFAK